MNFQPESKTNPRLTYAMPFDPSPSGIELPCRHTSYGPVLGDAPRLMLFSHPYSPEYVLPPRHSSCVDSSFPLYSTQPPYTSGYLVSPWFYTLPRLAPYCYPQFSLPYASLPHLEVNNGPDSSFAQPSFLPKHTRDTPVNPPILPSLSRMDGINMPPLTPTQVPPCQLTSPAAHMHDDNASRTGSACNRCRKKFIQDDIASSPESGIPKIFKLCGRCRAQQRERSRRWLDNMKRVDGACRRCGSEIPPGPNIRFVLCAECRLRLRTRKKMRDLKTDCASGVSHAQQH